MLDWAYFSFDEWIGTLKLKNQRDCVLGQDLKTNQENEKGKELFYC